jgi:hypothetical protein
MHTTLNYTIMPYLCITIMENLNGCHVINDVITKKIMQLVFNYTIICGPTINMQLNLNLKIEIWTRYAKANDMWY